MRLGDLDALLKLVPPEEIVARMAIMNAPTVEARPTGEWNEVEEGCGWTEILCAECSVCKSTFVLGEMTIDDVRDNFKFCSNCGAKMKGEKVRKNE